MARVAIGSECHVGRGAVWLDTTGAGKTLRHIGTCDSLSVSPTDIQTITKKDRTQKGAPTLSEVVTEQSFGIKLVMAQLNVQNLALGTLGEVNETVNSTTPVVDRSFAGVKQDRAVFVGANNISAVTVKVGASTKTITTDYTLDLRTGMVYIVPGGGIADDATILVSFTPLTFTTKRVRLSKVAKIEGYMLFVPDNATGKAHTIHLPKVSMTPDGDINWITDDYSTIGLSGKVIADAENYPNEPNGWIDQLD